MALPCNFWAPSRVTVQCRIHSTHNQPVSHLVPPSLLPRAGDLPDTLSEVNQIHLSYFSRLGSTSNPVGHLSPPAGRIAAGAGPARRLVAPHALGRQVKGATARIREDGAAPRPRFKAPGGAARGGAMGADTGQATRPAGLCCRGQQRGGRCRGPGAGPGRRGPEGAALPPGC